MNEKKKKKTSMVDYLLTISIKRKPRTVFSVGKKKYFLPNKYYFCEKIYCTFEFRHRSVKRNLIQVMRHSPLKAVARRTKGAEHFFRHVQPSF